MIRGKYLPSTTSPRGLWEMWECGLIPYGVYLANAVAQLGEAACG